MTAAHSAKNTRSEPGLDAFRCLAVVMMFVVHAFRLQAPRSRSSGGALEALLELFMWAEPYVAATFLFVAGISLVLSKRKAKSTAVWLRKLALRALGLYALSVLLFVAQFGVDLPDLLASSGILSAIAVAIVLTGLMLASPKPNWTLAALGIATVGVGSYLEATARTVSGLNGGPGGAVPLIAFTAFGALLARLVQRRGKRALGWVIALTAPLCAFAVFSHAAWTQNVVSRYADLGGQLAVTALWDPELLARAPHSAVVFWNHSVVGVAGLLLPLSASLAVALFAPKRAFAARGFGPVLLVGRHALAVYVMHLGVLGVLDVAGVTPPSAAWTWVTIAALFALAVAVAFVLERRPQRLLFGLRAAER